MSLEPTHPTKRRCPWKPIVLIVAIFCLGAICGAGGMAVIATKRLQSVFRENMIRPELALGPGDRLFQRLDQGISNELDLDPAERTAVTAELDESRNQLRHARGTVREELRRIAGDTVRRVGGRLPDDKRAKFREMAIRRLRPWGLESAANP